MAIHAREVDVMLWVNGQGSGQVSRLHLGEEGPWSRCLHANDPVRVKHLSSLVWLG